MGNSSSATVEQFNKNVSESINTSMTNIVSKNSAKLSGTQSVEIKNLQCANIKIGDITQTMVSKFDFTRLASVVTRNEVQAMMTNAVLQAAETDAGADLEFGAIANSTTSNVKTKTENINRVVNSYGLNQFTDDMQKMALMQEVRILDLGGENCENIEIGNISQDIYMEMVVKQIAETATEAFASLIADNKTEQTGTSKAFLKATGPIGDLGRAAANILEGAGKMIGAAISAPIMMMVGLIMVFVVIGFIIRTMGKLGKGDSGADTGMPMMGMNAMNMDATGMNAFGPPPPLPEGMGDQSQSYEVSKDALTPNASASSQIPPPLPEEPEEF